MNPRRTCGLIIAAIIIAVTLVVLLINPCHAQNPTAKIVAHWPLDDDNVWADAVGGLTLTESGAPLNIAVVAGKVGNAADLETGGYLQMVDHATVSFGDVSMALSAWVKLESEPANQMGIIAKDATSSGNRDYGLNWNNAEQKFRFYRGTTGTSITSIVANSMTATTPAQYYWVCGWYNEPKGRIYVRVYDATAATWSIDSTTYSGTAYDSNVAFAIGNFTSSGSLFFDGIIDEVDVWNAVPTYGTATSDMEVIVNGGAGRVFPYIAAQPTVQATSLSFTDVTQTSFTVNWTSGDGSNEIVLIKSGSAVNSNPVDETSYTANTAFGSGSEIGTGNFVVYNSTSNSVAVTGLTAGTTYHVAVYAFYGASGTENYLLAPLTGNQATEAEPSVGIILKHLPSQNKLFRLPPF